MKKQKFVFCVNSNIFNSWWKEKWADHTWWITLYILYIIYYIIIYCYSYILGFECRVCNNLSRLLFGTYLYPPRRLFWVFACLERHYLQNRISGICKLTIFMHRLAVNITHLKYKHIFLNILFNSTYYYVRTAFDSQSKIVVVSLKTVTRMRSFKSDFFCVVHDEHIIQITFIIIITK